MSSRLGSNRIRAEFSCNCDTGGAPLSYKGVITAQRSCFHSDINGVEAFCDGKKLILLDRENREAYIENAAGLEEYLKANASRISSLRFSELRYSDISEDLSEFSFDLSALGADWVVTDLREE